MNIFTQHDQYIILPTLAIIYLIASVASSHQEVKGHFSFFAKLIIGFCIGAFAADLIAYMANGRQTSLSSVSGYNTSSNTLSVAPSGVNGGMPWDGVLNGLYDDLAKYVVIVVGGIAFIIGGIVFMYGVGSRAMHWKTGSFETIDSSSRFLEWQQELNALAISGDARSYLIGKAASIYHSMSSAVRSIVLSVTRKSR